MQQSMRASVIVDLNMGDALSGINQLKSGLKGLKIPENATKGFRDNLTDLVAEVDKFNKMRSEPIKAGDKASMNKLEQSYNKILKLASRVNSEFSQLGNKGIKLIPDSELDKMSKLQEAWRKQKQLQNDIAAQQKRVDAANAKYQKEESKYQNKIDNLTAQRNQSKQVSNDLLKLKTVKAHAEAVERTAAAREKLSQAEKNSPAYKKASKELKVAKEEERKTGNKLTQHKTEDRYIQYEEEIKRQKDLEKKIKETQNNLSGAKLKGGSLNQISQEIDTLTNGLKQLQSASSGSLDKIRSEFANLTGISLSSVTSDVNELENEIKQLQNIKINNLVDNLQELGRSSGLDNLTDDLRQGQQQLQQYRGEFDKLTMKQRDIDDMKYRLTNFFSWSEGLNLVKMGAREAFRTVKDLDDAMTGTAVVTDFSVSELWDMMPKYTEVANKLGATVQGAYETMTLYYQQGLDTEAAFGMGEETMKMSRIADMDYVEGTDLMTAAIRGFHMDLNKSSAKRVNDVYSELAAVSASDTHEIATAMTKTASIADSANAEFDNTAAFLTQMINLATYTR